MARSSLIYLLWIILAIITDILVSSIVSVHSFCPPAPSGTKAESEFKQKTSKFWEFKEESNTWVEISLPFDLMSCIDGTCTKVASIEGMMEKREKQEREYAHSELERGESFESLDHVLPVRKRVSLNRMSEASVWVTGQSGSIYERFWNGVNWVIAPHELPAFAGYAVSTFIVNQTILALSEDGVLYQLKLNENSQPVWTEIMFMQQEQSMGTDETEQNQAVNIKSGVVSYDGKKLLLPTMNGSLIEITEFQPLRWENHGRPPGGDVSAVADTGNIRPGILFTISTVLVEIFMNLTRNQNLHGKNIFGVKHQQIVIFH